MINIYCSNKLAKLLKLPKLDYSPEETQHQWIAHVFKLEDTDNIIFMDTKTFYAVMAFDIKIKDDLMLRELFLKNFSKQLQDDLVELPPETSLENASKVFNVHSSSNDQRTMAILKNVLAKVTSVYDTNKNILDSKQYTKKHLNAIPWKINSYQSAKESMHLEVAKYW